MVIMLLDDPPTAFVLCLLVLESFEEATTLIPEQLSYIMLAITCSENVYARPCI